MDKSVESIQVPERAHQYQLYNYCFDRKTLALAVMSLSLLTGCADLRSAHTWSRDYGLRRMPVDAPAGEYDGLSGNGRPLKYDEATDGGTLYKQHCFRCHNGRPLAERSFSQNEVSLAHMRDFSGLTGEEYRKILHYMRRWHGVGPATPDVEPSPKRFFYDHPDKQQTVEPETIQLSDQDDESLGKPDAAEEGSSAVGK